jgi:hypothetical protein
MSRETSEDIRQWMKAKHERQQREMLDRLSAVDQELEAIVAGQRSALDCVNVAGYRTPDADGARELMQAFDTECEQVIATTAQREEEAREVGSATHTPITFPPPSHTQTQRERERGARRELLPMQCTTAVLLTHLHFDRRA